VRDELRRHTEGMLLDPRGEGLQLLVERTVEQSGLQLQNMEVEGDSLNVTVNPTIPMQHVNVTLHDVNNGVRMTPYEIETTGQNDTP
jgi:hypothetical protein